MGYRLACVTAVACYVILAGCEALSKEEICDTDLADMQDTVVGLVASGQACRSDQDCILLDVSNGCYGACPVAVSRFEAPRVENAVWDADDRYCATFIEECGYLTPNCPPLRPVCDQGLCRVVEDL